MYQSYILIGLSLAVLMLVIQTAKAWQTARSLRQLIALSPQVCEICARKASAQNHNTTSGDYNQPGNGGIFFADTHQYVPAQMVFLPSKIPGDTGTEIHPDTRHKA